MSVLFPSSTLSASEEAEKFFLLVLFQVRVDIGCDEF